MRLDPAAALAGALRTSHSPDAQPTLAILKALQKAKLIERTNTAMRGLEQKLDP